MINKPYHQLLNNTAMQASRITSEITPEITAFFMFSGEFI
jgi:hypothetical protein